MGHLDAFRPELWLELGLSADWGEEFIALIRKLEPEDYDLANLETDVRAWFLRQQLLFQDLRILDELPDVGPEFQSCTHSVVRNAMECPTLFVGGRAFHPWSRQRGDHDVFKQVAEKASNMIEAVKDRVQSELLGTHQTDWQCFSLQRWQDSRRVAVDEQRTFEQNLRSRLRRLLKGAALHVDRGTGQFFRAVPILAEKYSVEMEATGVVPDNRRVWSHVFGEAFAQEATNGAPMGELRLLACQGSRQNQHD